MAPFSVLMPRITLLNVQPVPFLCNQPMLAVIPLLQQIIATSRLTWLIQRQILISGSQQPMAQLAQPFYHSPVVHQESFLPNSYSWITQAPIPYQLVSKSLLLAVGQLLLPLICLTQLSAT